MILVSVLTVMIVIIMMFFFLLTEFLSELPPGSRPARFWSSWTREFTGNMQKLENTSLGSRRLESSIRDKPSFGTRVWLDMIQNEQKISWAKFHQRVQIHRTWVYKVDAMLHSSWKQHKECFWWYLMAEPSNWCTDHVQSPHGFRTQDAKDVSPSIHPPKMSSRV